MKEQDKHIHQLAILYFEGRIERSKEKELYLFVNATPRNHSAFRQWEKEWMLSSVPGMEVNDQWEQLRRRTRIQEAISSLFHIKKYNIRQIAAVAAILIVVFGGGILGLLSHKSSLTDPAYFSLETAYGEKSKMVLTDGTVVWLNAGSTLRYADNFTTENREVILNGEAYFEVKKQKGGTPFSVKTAHYEIVVKGTKFNVSSYAEDAFSTTTLLEGAIDVLYKGKQISLNPGESLNFDKKGGSYTCHYVQASQYRSWVEGRIEYNEITLNELAIRLSRKYDVQIHLDAELDKNATFRISLRNEETIDQFLQALSKIIPIRFQRQEREIYIRKQ